MDPKMGHREEIKMTVKKETLKHHERKHALSVKNLNKAYKKRQVVRNVSLSVHQGEVVGLLGPNGAGKTTTFYMVVGLIRPDSGNIFLDNQDITDFPMFQRARQGVGYLAQDPSIFRKLTVWENIMAVLEMNNTPKQERESRCQALMKELNIKHLARQKAYTLSGGERRRVEISRTLATSPRFILLDEPFVGIDPLAVLDIQNIIRQLKKKGLGILITDHNVRETLAITDHSYIMYAGEILLAGTSKQLVKDKKAKEIYLGEKFTL